MNQPALKITEEAQKAALSFKDDWFEAHAFNARVGNCIERGNAENEAIKDIFSILDYIRRLELVKRHEVTTNDGKRIMNMLSATLDSIFNDVREWASEESL